MEGKKTEYNEKFNKLAKELEVYRVNKTTRSDGKVELDIPLNTTVLVVRPGNRFRGKPRTNSFIGNFIGTECVRNQKRGFDCTVVFNNILKPTFEQQQVFLEDYPYSEDVGGDPTKFQQEMASWDVNNHYILFYNSKPFQAIAELPHAQLKDSSGNVLPPLPLGLQSHLASYFREAKPKQVREGEKPQMTHEPQGLPETYTKERQRQVRQAIKERQEQREQQLEEEALAAMKTGGRRGKTKKSRKSRKITRRR